MELENRINELESRLAFMEVTINELNEVITGQQQHMELMHKLLERLKEQLEDLASDRKTDLSDEPPPHY